MAYLTAASATVTLRWKIPKRSLFFSKRFVSSVLATAQEEAWWNEHCILVDEEDRAIGFDNKRNCHAISEVAGSPTIPLHRAFSVFAFNQKGDIVMQQRAPTKFTYPNLVTNACCSHPLYNVEEERDGLRGVKLAAQRRLHFELGMPLNDCSPSQLHFLTKLHYFSPGDGKWGEHEIDYILILRSGTEGFNVVPNKDEVSRLFYVKKDEMRSFAQSVTLTPWFRLVMDNWLFKWWDNLDNLSAYEDNHIHSFPKQS